MRIKKLLRRESNLVHLHLLAPPWPLHYVPLSFRGSRFVVSKPFFCAIDAVWSWCRSCFYHEFKDTFERKISLSTYSKNISLYFGFKGPIDEKNRVAVAVLLRRESKLVHLHLQAPPWPLHYVPLSFRGSRFVVSKPFFCAIDAVWSWCRSCIYHEFKDTFERKISLSTYYTYCTYCLFRIISVSKGRSMKKNE